MPGEGKWIPDQPLLKVHHVWQHAQAIQIAMMRAGLIFLGCSGAGLLGGWVCGKDCCSASKRSSTAAWGS